MLLAEVVELLGTQLSVHQRGAAKQGDRVQGREDAAEATAEERIVDGDHELRHGDGAVIIHVEHVKEMPDLGHHVLLQELHQQLLRQEVDRALLDGRGHLPALENP